MLYYLFQYLEKFQIPGAGVFEYISFRAGLAIILSLIISTIYGRKLIDFLQRKQIGETIRDLGLEGQYQKKGTPTMGGIIIIIAILLPTLLFAKLHNVYIILMIITTVWLGMIGFIDDYIKVFKKNKQGLSGKLKLLGQIILAIIVGLVFFFNKNVVVREKVDINSTITKNDLYTITGTSTNEKLQIDIFVDDRIEKKLVEVQGDIYNREKIIESAGMNPDDTKTMVYAMVDHRSTTTTIPFFKDNQFDYASLVAFLGDYAKYAGWLAFVIIVIVIITAVSNGANITDGLDGLAAGTSAIIGTTLGIFAYVSGNIIVADYLNIMYLPNVGELVVFVAAFMGATVGFLWYNSFPAQVFMGDTGSLTIGGIIAVFAIAVRKELLIPILCGIFLVENLSVMIQVSYFKYTKKKYGAGRRIFLMAPLHHHFQKKGYTEPKIVARFWIVGILLAVLTFITLKLR